jgi:hypothetical protein
LLDADDAELETKRATLFHTRVKPLSVRRRDEEGLRLTERTLLIRSDLIVGYRGSRYARRLVGIKKRARMFAPVQAPDR